MSLDALKLKEERKRDAAYDARARWLHIQQTITWAEANLPPEQRRNRPRWPALQAPPAQIDVPSSPAAD